MRLFSNGLRDWRQSWQNDLRASVSVAFIAIPLGLGIGLASGVPPIAGIIPCVIGGLIIAWFSGGNLAVHSTPKMLIGVTAAGVIALGGDDPFLGYRLFLSVVVIAGTVQFLLGFLRAGIVGELIPATVIKSLLTAVGVIIIIKQLPVLLGVSYHGHSIIESIGHIPDFIVQENPVIAFIGICSIIIMFLHPRIELPIIQAVPAAVWVILFAELYSYSIGFEEGGSFNILGTIFSYNKSHLVNIPNQLSEAVVYPDFSMINTSIFWNLVLAVVVVSSIEGILSTKAVDRLDPLKRKSNVNKELSVIGLGSAFSGLIGGLPVIPAIVASSVGINHNSKSQLVDIFHAAMILLLVVLLGTQLQHIPLAALAGILIHTGYKLVNPKEILNIYRIGLDQILIFAVTLCVTLTTDLILGIGVGVLVTTLIHVIRLRSITKLFTILFRPNVVAYEEDEDNAYHISVKGYSNFLNYPRLKKSLDVIPLDSKIVVDVSLAEFIDHSVMEHLAEYEELSIRRGGQFEIIGLDTHLSSARHPLSVRYKGYSNAVQDKQQLTSRQQKLLSLTKQNDWEFDIKVKKFVPEFQQFHLLRHRIVDRSYNRIYGEFEGSSFLIEDIDFQEGEFHKTISGQTTAALIQLTSPVPLFTIEKEHLFDRIAALAGFDDIDFKQFKKFSDTFRLKGKNEQAIRNYFSKELITFLESNPQYRVESSGKKLLLLGKERPMSVTEIENLIKFIKNLIMVLPPNH